METISRENAPQYIWGEDCLGWHLLKTPGLSVIQERVPPGQGEVRHRHERAQQFFFVLSGEATMELAEKKIVIGPQQGLAVAPGTFHLLRNEGNMDLSFLVISSPPSHGDRMDGQ
jgi:mannose-6-phosphate isomerase-like protein (cupin superfamily)